MKTISTLFLSVSLALPLFAESVSYQRVTFLTKDGTRLTGLYKAPERNAPVLVALHGFASAKEEWFPLTTEMEKRGWGWFIYDGRGQGDSSLTRGADGAPNGYKYFHAPGPGSEWERMIDDVGSALQYLEKEHGIKRAQVSLAGASLGANIALSYAALSRYAGKILLLSPGLDYQKITTEPMMTRVPGKSILMIASSADQYAYASCRTLKELAPKSEFWSDVKAGHGVQMFDSTLLKRIADWFDASR